MGKIRLSKICKDLNVTFMTVAEWMHAHGYSFHEDLNCRIEDSIAIQIYNELGGLGNRNQLPTSNNPKVPTTTNTGTFNTKIVGRIDLDAINQSTRPPKERNDKRRGRGRDKSEHTTDKSQPNTISTSIKELWQYFVDVQEQIIKQRCAPISIIPEATEIEGNKLYVNVDESQDKAFVESIIKEQLGVTEYDLDDGYILVDEDKWEKLSNDDLLRIRKELAQKYIELNTTPTIDLIVDYSNGGNRNDQLTLEELFDLERLLAKHDVIEGNIDEKAAFISKISVDRDGLLEYLFGDRVIISHKKSHGKIIELPLILCHNEYIDWQTFSQYKDIGLYCQKYTLIFKINNIVANEELIDRFDCYFGETQTFEFKRSYTSKSPFTEDFINEIYANIDKFMEIASLYCSAEDITVDVDFVYGFSPRLLAKMKFDEIANYLFGKDGYSFNSETGAIGIDFNWHTDNINEIIKVLENDIPFIKVNTFEDHKYKCKVNCQLVGFEDFRRRLEDKYEDVKVVNDGVNRKMLISLPYTDSSEYDTVCAWLLEDLLPFKFAGLNIIEDFKPKGKVRLNISYNAQSRIEDIEDSISNMRKAEFGICLGDKDIKFGKLLKSNYPELIFDIDVSEDQLETIVEAFESGAVTTIAPILTGDLEKIHRLKDTFTRATTGGELYNVDLQRFIFDSSEAKKTIDIGIILKRDGSAYVDLCKNLLNGDINESQKQAILKAMFAEDLAVIQGPPGTGKSTAIAELIWQLIRNGLKHGNRKERILLTSETNLAVDNAISRIINGRTNLVKPIRLGDEEKLESEGLQFSLALMKRWVEDGDTCLYTDEIDEDSGAVIKSDLILKNWIENISNRSFYGLKDEDSPIVSRWRRFLTQTNKELREIVFKRYLEYANVVGATCSSIGDRRAGTADFNGFTPFYHSYCEIFNQPKGKAKIEFTTVIQDESSKSTPAELVLPFVYGHKAIVIGDHRQLPPMLDREEFEDTLEYALKLTTDTSEKEKINQLRSFVDRHFQEMEISHFQRLYENIDESLKGTFNLQYRMHPDINEVIEQFYREDGGLKCGLITPVDLGVNIPDPNNKASRYHGINIPGIITPNTHIVFIDTSSPEMLDGTSRINYGEIDTIDKLLSYFEESDSYMEYVSRFQKEDDKQIGIISFYGKQIKHIREVARKHPGVNTRVSTVDRFQGMERNIVIVSMVRSHIIQGTKGQLPNWKRYPEYGYPKQTSLGFAESPNRLNVALSRAKRLLIILGNRELFSLKDIYQRLFITIESNPNNIILNQNDI